MFSDSSAVVGISKTKPFISSYYLTPLNKPNCVPARAEQRSEVELYSGNGNTFSLCFSIGSRYQGTSCRVGVTLVGAGHLSSSQARDLFGRHASFESTILILFDAALTRRVVHRLISSISGSPYVSVSTAVFYQQENKWYLNTQRWAPIEAINRPLQTDVPNRGNPMNFRHKGTQSDELN
jgi:hypothetical protein